jgi:ATP-binding cassette subfamily B multidrug efflux pump
MPSDPNAKPSVSGAQARQAAGLLRRAAHPDRATSAGPPAWLVWPPASKSSARCSARS